MILSRLLVSTDALLSYSIYVHMPIQYLQKNPPLTPFLYLPLTPPTNTANTTDY